MSFTEYKVGDIAGEGTEIKSILASSNKAIVFIDVHDVFQYECMNIEHSRANSIISEFNRIRAMMPTDLDSKTRFTIKKITFKGLYNALNEEDINEGLKILSTVRKRLKHIKIEVAIKIYFIIWTIIYSFIFAIGMYFIIKLNSNLEEPLAAIIGGCLGACFSVVLRNKKLTIDNLSSNATIHQQVFIRLGWGIISGLILFFVVKANLLLGIANSNIYILFTFAVVAGFSERFIPDFLNQLVQEKEAQINAKVKSQ